MLARGYTFAELNHPQTKPTHKFRWASVAKFLNAMRAVHGDGAADWLHSTLETVYFTAEQRQVLEVSVPAERLGWFRQLRVIDLYRFSAGWVRDRDLEPGDLPHARYHYHNRVFSHTGKDLPLRPGDFRDYLVRSKLEPQNRAPHDFYRYNNPAFWAASEALSMRVFGQDASLYVQAMHDFWGTSDLDAGVTRPSRNECLNFGEVVCRHPPAFSRATSVGESTLKKSGQPLPPFTPTAYYGGTDIAMEVGSGLITMSAPLMVRILQGMHPNPPPPVRPLLTLDEIALLASTDEAVRQIGRASCRERV
mgnify:CR=1 FL=1